ncbi:MAG TPA: NUDIX domain-containing protein [Thermoanaerobaculia bacterium]|nr:NUDIX domain-containing protein [Thermoanaerobaculia bacterium]
MHHHLRMDRWLQMGGHVEGEELPEAAALREGAEESGLDDRELAPHAVFDLDIHGIPAAKGEPDHEHSKCDTLPSIARNRTNSHGLTLERTAGREISGR